MAPQTDPPLAASDSHCRMFERLGHEQAEAARIAGEVVHQRDCRRHRLGIAGEACSEFFERTCTGGDSVDRPPGAAFGSKCAFGQFSRRSRSGGGSPRLSAGTNPARTMDDLPLPHAPTTARKRLACKPHGCGHSGQGGSPDDQRIFTASRATWQAVPMPTHISPRKLDGILARTRASRNPACTASPRKLLSSNG